MIIETARQQCQTSFQWKPLTKGTWGEMLTLLTTTNDPCICPYCKNEQTTPCVDSSVLLSYKENPSFKGLVFKVFECYCCNAILAGIKGTLLKIIYLSCHNEKKGCSFFSTAQRERKRC